MEDGRCLRFDGILAVLAGMLVVISGDIKKGLSGFAYLAAVFCVYFFSMSREGIDEAAQYGVCRDMTEGLVDH